MTSKRKPTSISNNEASNVGMSTEAQGPAEIALFGETQQSAPINSNTKWIYSKMSKVMSDIGSVTKDQKNVQQGFKFRGIDQFVNALYPALTKHGVFMTPRVTSYKTEIKEVTRSSGKQGMDKHVELMVEYDFYAEDGSYLTVGPIAAEGLDSGDKATNKALSAALKYALIQTFSIPTEDMEEGDKTSPEIGNSSVSNSASTSTATSNGSGAGSFKKQKPSQQAKEQSSSTEGNSSSADGWQ